MTDITTEAEVRHLPVGENIAPQTRATMMDLLNYLSSADDLLDSLGGPLLASAEKHCTGYYLHDHRFHATLRRHQDMVARLREVRFYIWHAYLRDAPDAAERAEGSEL